MKRTQVTELFATIKATFVSFFSILLFVALAVALYCGMCWSSLAIKNANNEELRKDNLHALEITFPYGLTDDDIDAIKDVDGVESVEPGYISYQTFTRDDVSNVAMLRSVTGDVDSLTILEGRAPEAVGEAVVNEVYAENENLKVGDTITFAHDDDSAEDGMKYLNCDSVKIVGIARNVATLARSASALGNSTDGRTIACALFVTADTFDYSTLDNAYNVVEVSCSGLEGLSVFSDEYENRVNTISDAVKQLGTTRAQERSKAILAKAQVKVDEAKAQLEEARAKISDGAAQIDDAQSQLDSKLQELRETQVKLETAGELLTTQGTQSAEMLSQTAQQLSSFRTMYNEAAEQLAQKQSDYAEKLDAYLEKYEQVMTVQSFITNTNVNLTELKTNKAELDRQLAAGEIDEDTHLDRLDEYCTQYNEKEAAERQALQEAMPEFYESNEAYIVTVTQAPHSFLSSDIFDDELELMLDALDTLETSFKPVKEAADEAKSLADQASSELSSMSSQMDEIGSKLTEVEQQYKTARAQYESQISSSKSQVTSGLAQVEDYKSQAADAQSLIDEKRTELEEATKKVEDGTAQLEAAEQRVSSLSEMSWSVRNARYNNLVRGTEKVGLSLASLRYSMASLFIIVGLLVCHSAVSRIVHEQVVLVGTKKAMGFTDREVTFSYLAYAGVAAIVGTVIGAILAVVLVENIMLNSVTFTVMGKPTWAFDIRDYLVIAAIELVLILLSTYLACHGVLKREAIKLLAGEEPPSGATRFYEKWGIWKRMGLLTQTVVNNVVNDRRRVLATVIGVAGCCSLIVCALYLRDNVNVSVNRQTNDILTYDSIVYCTPTEEGAEAAEGSTDAVLTSEGVEHTAVMSKTMAVVQPDSNYAVARVTVPQDSEAFSKMYHLISQGSSEGCETPVDGVWVSSAYSTYFNAKVGDKIKIMNSLGQEYEVPIAGFFEYHSSFTPIVMSASCYEKYLDEKPSYNCYLVDAGSKTNEEIASDLSANANDYVSYTDVMADVKLLASTSTKLMMALVAVYVILAAVLAFVVLLNLNVMFVNEKKRELIVLMINGYSTRDAKRYIYRDNIVMTMIGIVAGCLLGLWAGSYSLASSETASLAFCHQISWMAIGIGTLVCALFSAVVTLIALRRIDKFQLTDINKA